MFIWIFYWIPFNIVATTFLCAIYSAINKAKKEIVKKFGSYKKLSSDNDIGEKIIRLIQLAFICLCPILNIFLSAFLITKWKEFRDEIVLKSYLAYEKKRIEYELENKNE